MPTRTDMNRQGTDTTMAEAPPVPTLDPGVDPTVDPRLWMLVSPTLPVGGYSYSQGMEHAVLTGRL